MAATSASRMSRATWCTTSSLDPAYARSSLALRLAPFAARGSPFSRRRLPAPPRSQRRRRTSTKEQQEFFEKKIAPIFSENCYKCHSAAEKMKGGLVLDTREALLKGGDDGKISSRRSGEEHAHPARHFATIRMRRCRRRTATLTAAQVADLTQWVKMGAPVPRRWPQRWRTIAARSRWPRGRMRKQHWAWQPVRMPAGAAGAEYRAGQDAGRQFHRGQAGETASRPRPPADRATLIRRAYFDLVGLPPMPWEVQAFVDDKAPNAWEKVDRPAARLAALRRALGPLLARCRALLRHQGRRQQEGDAALRRCLDVSRLRDRRLQCGQAVRPLHHRADRRGQAEPRARTSARSPRSVSSRWATVSTATRTT